MKRDQQDIPTGKIRAFGITLILIEIGILFAYGFGAQMTPESTSTPQSDFSLNVLDVVLASLLALLGYGMLLAYSLNSAMAGLTTALMAVTLSVQLTPLLLSFWNDVFYGFGGEKAVISIENVRISIILVSSLMIGFSILAGRLGPFETLIMIIGFIFGWTFSFELSRFLLQEKGPKSPLVYDDYGTGYLFIYGSYFALTASMMLNCKSNKLRPHATNTSVMMGLIGTGTIFALFPFSGPILPTTVTAEKVFEGPMNIYISLTASTITCYVFSAICGGGNIGVREAILGVLSGGVTIAAVAGSIQTIGASIAIGFFSGAFSGFWLRVVHPRVNGKKPLDHLGLLGPVLILSTVGQLCLAPALYLVYENRSTVNPGLGAEITNEETSTFQLAFGGIAAATAIIAAFLVSIIALCCHDPELDYRSNVLASRDYGLYRNLAKEEPPKSESNEYKETAKR